MRPPTAGLVVYRSGTYDRVLPIDLKSVHRRRTKKCILNQFMPRTRSRTIVPPTTLIGKRGHEYWSWYNLELLAKPG